MWYGSKLIRQTLETSKKNNNNDMGGIQIPNYLEWLDEQ